MINRHFLNLIIQILEAQDTRDHPESTRLQEEAIMDVMRRKAVNRPAAQAQVTQLIRSFTHPEIEAIRPPGYKSFP